MASKSIFSMTGFAATEDSLTPDFRIRIDVKSLNHRFLDVKVKVPKELCSIEGKLRAFLLDRFERGSLDFRMDLVSSAQEISSGTTPDFQINVQAAKTYLKSIQQLKKELSLDAPITLRDILSLPEVIEKKTVEFDPEFLWNTIQPLAEKAARQLSDMRKTEGDQIAASLTALLRSFESCVDHILKKRATCEGEYRLKIAEKIATLFQAYPMAQLETKDVLETRIAQELALLLDRTDVKEELARLAGHIQHFNGVLQQGGPCGRKLEFLLQELLREINTLGNKAQDSLISEHVVQCKVILEQLREQVMNVE